MKMNKTNKNSFLSGKNKASEEKKDVFAQTYSLALMS
jgi:hypothetical protein